jgi:hypothetical protein
VDGGEVVHNLVNPWKVVGIPAALGALLLGSIFGANVLYIGLIDGCWE